MLRNCIDLSLNDKAKIEGVLEAVRAKFKVIGDRDLLSTIQGINVFRNKRVADQEKELTDSKLAEKELEAWITGLSAIA